MRLLVCALVALGLFAEPPPTKTSAPVRHRTSVKSRVKKHRAPKRKVRKPQRRHSKMRSTASTVTFSA